MISTRYFITPHLVHLEAGVIQSIVVRTLSKKLSFMQWFLPIIFVLHKIYCVAIPWFQSIELLQAISWHGCNINFVCCSPSWQKYTSSYKETSYNTNTCVHELELGYRRKLKSLYQALSCNWSTYQASKYLQSKVHIKDMKFTKWVNRKCHTSLQFRFPFAGWICQSVALHSKA